MVDSNSGGVVIRTQTLLRAFIAAGLLLTFTCPAQAKKPKIDPERAVVTSTRLMEQEGMTTSYMTVIRSDEIERMGVTTLEDLLLSVGVVSVIRQGGHGAPASLQIRGAEPGQSIILLDGIRINSAVTGELDISDIMLYDVERIEIARGPHTISYGSGAEAGVVNIITKKGGGETSLSLNYSYASNATHEPGISLTGGKKYHYRLSAAYAESDGISHMRGDDLEDDAYELTSYSGYLAIPLGKNGAIEFIGSRTDGTKSLDILPPGSIDILDDPDLTQERQREMYLSRLAYMSKNSIMHTVTVSQWTQNSLTLDPTYELYDYGLDSYSTVDHSRQENTTVQVAEYQADTYDGQRGVAVIGISQRTEILDSLITNDTVSDEFTEQLDTASAFMNIKMEDGPMLLVFGARQMSNNEYGDFTTYRISALQNEGGDLFYLAAYATGVRLPSVGQFHITNGIGLEAETSKSWEFGFTSQYSRNTALEVTYFDQEIYMPIVTNSIGIPVNGNELEINGVEAALTHRSSDALSFMLSYTWIDATDKITDKPLEMRAEDRIDCRIGYGGRGFSLQLDYTYMGARYDPQIAKDLAPYNIVHLGGQYKFGNTFSIYGRVGNVLDEGYTDLGGFDAPLREYRLGLKAVF